MKSNYEHRLARRQQARQQYEILSRNTERQTYCIIDSVLLFTYALAAYSLVRFHGANLLDLIYSSAFFTLHVYLRVRQRYKWIDVPVALQATVVVNVAAL